MVRISGHHDPLTRRMVDSQNDLYEVLGVARDASEVQARGLVSVFQDMRQNHLLCDEETFKD